MLKHRLEEIQKSMPTQSDNINYYMAYGLHYLRAMKLIIRASTNIQDLQGNGLEYLVDDDGYIRAEFYNGKFVRALKQVSESEAQEITLKAA